MLRTTKDGEKNKKEDLMFKAYDMECKACGERLGSELVEYDVDKHAIIEEILCPECGELMVPAVDNYTASGNVHSSFGRWNDHNMVG
jgi:transcription elongation factor Elf1